MATCPRCKGYLADAHRCPRHRGLTALEIAGAAVAGGAAGLLLVIVFDPYGQIQDGYLDTFSTVAGALIAVGINRALRG